MVENVLPCPIVYTVKSAVGPDPPARPHLSGAQLAGREEAGAAGPRETGLAVGAQEPVYDVDLGPGRSVWVSIRIPCKGFAGWSSWAVLRLPPAPDVDAAAAVSGASGGLGPEQLGWAGTDPRLRAAKGDLPLSWVGR